MCSKGGDYSALYDLFQHPITQTDCGEMCAPYNEGRIPFCCDSRHAVPTASSDEWNYLQQHTDLWHPWEPLHKVEKVKLEKQCPEGHVLIECKGHALCQREFRSITCRAFPFFPYISRNRNFLGLSYYWEYEDRCWVLSHLEAVSRDYRQAFIQSFDTIFIQFPAEFEIFWYHSMVMRRIFGRRKRAIPLLHRNGRNYKLTPRNGRMRLVNPGGFPLYDPYLTAKSLPFKDELDGSHDTAV